MVVTTVMVSVKPEHVDEFITATIENHEASVREQGNMRFDILQSEDEPAKFLLYEAYESADRAAAHKNTDHYAKWRDRVVGWMAEPRKGIKYKGLRPE